MWQVSVTGESVRHEKGASIIGHLDNRGKLLLWCTTRSPKHSPTHYTQYLKVQTFKGRLSMFKSPGFNECENYIVSSKEMNSLENAIKCNNMFVHEY